METSLFVYPRDSVNVKPNILRVQREVFRCLKFLYPTMHFQTQEMFVQIFSCMHTWNRYRCQEYARKYYIVVIKKSGALGCQGVANLPIYEIRQFSKCMVIQCAYYTVLRAVNRWIL